MEISALPIKFHRVTAGEYVSVAGPCSTDGEYRIYRTEHTGRNSTLSGRVRWHCLHVPTGRALYQPGRGYRHELTLESSIETLHRIIGQSMSGAFSVLAEINAAAERRIAEEQRKRDQRADIETRIRRGIMNTFVAGDLNEHNICSLVAAIADSLES